MTTGSGATWPITSQRRATSSLRCRWHPARKRRATGKEWCTHAQTGTWPAQPPCPGRVPGRQTTSVSDDFSLDELEQSSVVKGLPHESGRSALQNAAAISRPRIGGDWTRLTSPLLTSGTSP